MELHVKFLTYIACLCAIFCIISLRQINEAIFLLALAITIFLAIIMVLLIDINEKLDKIHDSLKNKFNFFYFYGVKE